MYKVKITWKTACFNLKQECRNPRFFITFLLAFVLCMMLSDKAVNFAGSYGTSMQAFEVFILAFGDGKSLMLSMLLIIFLFADIPVTTQITPYYISRITRNVWIWAQLLYVVMVTVLYVMFLLLATCVISMNLSFPGNMWSETMAMIGYSGAGKEIALPASVKVLEMSTPYECAAVIFLLVVGYALFNASMLLLVSIGRYPMLGRTGVFLLNLYGLFLNPKVIKKFFEIPETLEYKASVIAGWLSPLNHATYSMHNFGYDYLPRIWMSMTLFVVFTGINMIIIHRRAKKFEFIFMQRND